MPASADTRTRILQTSAALFWRQGYHATGVKQILAESGTASGSLYHFFPTKEDLLLAVLDEYKSRLRDQILEPAFAESDDPFERIFAVLSFYRRHLEENACSLGCPIGNAAAELSDTHPEARRKVAELFEAWAGGVLECLGAAADRLPEDADLQGLAHFVLTVMEGGVMQSRAGRSLAAFDASVRHLRRYFELLQGERRGSPERCKGEDR